jgi:hypothetical protein
MPVVVEMKSASDFDSAPLEEGIYNATIRDIQSKPGKFGPMLSWCFALEEDPERLVWGSCSNIWSNHPNNKLNKWLVALGHHHNPGDRLDLEELKEKACQILTKNNTDANGKVWSNVIDVLPAPRTAGQPKPQPKPKPQASAPSAPAPTPSATNTAKPKAASPTKDEIEDDFDFSKFDDNNENF